MKISDPVAKQYAALRIAMATPRIGIIMTANPSTLVEFARLANSRRESLIRDIFDGTLSPDLDLPAEIRQALRRANLHDVTRNGPRSSSDLPS